jgi:hypothetical protein
VVSGRKLGHHKETEAQRGSDLKTDSGIKNLKTENATGWPVQMKAVTSGYFS